MRPVLFLDIDGVLNSTGWADRRPKPFPPGWEDMRDWQRQATMDLDPDAVERLNRVVREGWCAVVLSSTWRKAYPLNIVTRMLQYRGFKRDLIGATPDLSPHYSTFRENPRGQEIQNWITRVLGTEKADELVYAIVDDDSDFLDHQKPYFVQTDFKYGLTDEDADRLIEILRKRP